MRTTGPRVAVLDHGYIELVDSWGSDERIVEAARMSTGKGFEGWKQENYFECPVCKYACAESLVPEDARLRLLRCPNDYQLNHALYGGMTLIETLPGDEKLLRYLWTHKHATPFEMAGMTIEVQAPIFVFREWHRHRTQSYNEMSARYTPLPDVNYIPTLERLLMRGGKNKQAQSVSEQLSPGMAETFRITLKDCYAKSERAYKNALFDGVPKELARLMIPVGRYSRMRASANLRNWLGFLTLRMDAAAQWEIRQYANEVAKFVEQLFPRTYTLFTEEQRKE